VRKGATRNRVGVAAVVLPEGATVLHGGTTAGKTRESEEDRTEGGRTLVEVGTRRASRTGAAEAAETRAAMVRKVSMSEV
jgi:hypothetical protein